MDDVTELERRIMYALERIGTAVDQWPEAGFGSSAVAATPVGETSIELDVLKAELEAERSANAQLTERVRAIKDKQENMVSALERKAARLGEQLDQLGAELQRQRRLNADLTHVNQALSDAARGGLSDPSLLNQALSTEVEALRAARASEMAEVAEILSELKPLIGEVA
ncbi:MAG TPA: hypothetical protein PK450_04235 [Paracoccaceae bacterium]|nr:hypothetical protein [Paracoccaceae bacterium]